MDALDQNIAAIKGLINPVCDFRLVVKSLPCPNLLAYAMQSADTNRLMVFHQPFLNHIADKFPKSDVLLGKPMPVAAAELFYENLNAQSEFSPSHQLQWLIDSQLRLQQYLQMAKKLGVKLKINFEIDVGLHRGGLTSISTFDQAMKLISANPQYLEFSGFMGYDPHVVKLPKLISSKQAAYDKSQNVYRMFVDNVKQHYPDIKIESLCLNGAGSPTIAMHKQDTIANELAAGSCLVMPTDFDIPTLAEFQPASFIATPVLKKLVGTKIPGIEFAANMMAKWDINKQNTFFIYGGKWMANYIEPRGLQANDLYGQSTNQQIVNGSSKVELDVDDYIFLRPHQSEFVFLQFGDLWPIRDGKIAEPWPILLN
ncbi:MAG: alanine racemase [Arenicella sp.]|nr:alanine racemase [Arenicella sp.]